MSLKVARSGGSLRRSVIKAQPAVSIYGWFAMSPSGADSHAAAEIFVAIGDAKYLLLGQPRCSDAAASHNFLTLNFEDVREIGADRYLKVETHRILAIVRDVNVLVQPTIDLTTDH